MDDLRGVADAIRRNAFPCPDRACRHIRAVGREHREAEVGYERMSKRGVLVRLEGADEADLQRAEHTRGFYVAIARDELLLAGDEVNGLEVRFPSEAAMLGGGSPGRA